MKNEAVQIAKIQDGQEFRRQVFALLQNPVYSMVVAFIIIEALQQIKLKSGDYFMGRAGTVLEGAILTKEAWNALAQSDALKTLLPAATKLLAAAG
jgi:hypothetical protein